MLLWLGHAAFRLSAGWRIYIDPINIRKDYPPADIILITHPHAAHCSAVDIARIATPETLIFGNTRCIEPLAGIRAHFSAWEPGRLFTADTLKVETVPAYGPGHDRRENGMGYIVTIAGQRIYHAGDTGLIPEMDGLCADIALLPVSGGTVMNAAEAAEAARQIRPSLAIPMHYGLTSGTIADARAFAGYAARNDVQVKLLTPA